MSKISTFLYCQGSQNNPQNGEISLNGPMQIITPRYIPSMFSFSIFIGIIELDLQQPHNLQIKFIKKDINKTVFETGVMNIPPQKNQIELPEDMRGFMANLDLRNVPLETEGEYETQIILDSELIGQFPIKVKEVKNG